MKRILLTAALLAGSLSLSAQCGWDGYEVKTENSYTHYSVRYSSNPKDAMRYDTRRLRGEFLIEKVMVPGEVHWTYTTIDRFLVGGAMPTTSPLALTSIAPLYVDLSKSDNGRRLLDNRELGIINVGGDGCVTVDGKRFDLAFQEALYVGKGAKEIVVESKDAQTPAKFYMNSACAHESHPTKKVGLKDAKNIEAGSASESNARVIHQVILNGVAGVRTCQLQMGITELQTGSVWNTMPAHTHLKRMEAYFYYNVPEGQKVCHIMGEPQETRLLWTGNEQAVISPEWSIHCAAGTASYTFIWGMAGENLIYNDMQVVKIPDLE